MLRFLLVAVLFAAAVAFPTDVTAKEQLVRIGSAGVTYLNIKGYLVPKADPATNIPTFVFRTMLDGELEEPTDGLVDFRCMPLDDVFTSAQGAKKVSLLCNGDVFQKKMVFLFSADGLEFPPEVKSVNLMLERRVIMNLNSVPETLLGSTILGDRVKRQFGLGFSGSGAQASSSSFGGGGGFGGFPGGGFGGSFSGSQASAGSGAFGGGGFFG